MCATVLEPFLQHRTHACPEQIEQHLELAKLPAEVVAAFGSPYVIGTGNSPN
jgi:hypothetical protein